MASPTVKVRIDGAWVDVGAPAPVIPDTSMLPLGYLDSDETGTAVIVDTAVQQALGVTVNWDAEPTRIYKTTLTIVRIDASATTWFEGGIVDAALATMGWLTMIKMDAGDVAAFSATLIEAGLNDPQTRMAKATTTTGPSTVQAGTLLVVEDIGGTTAALAAEIAARNAAARAANQAP